MTTTTTTKGKALLVDHRGSRISEMVEGDFLMEAKTLATFEHVTAADIGRGQGKCDAPCCGMAVYFITDEQAAPLAAIEAERKAEKAERTARFDARIAAAKAAYRPTRRMGYGEDVYGGEVY